MAEKITGRLQTPKDGSGKRVDIHLLTTTDEVITPDGKTMTEHMNDGSVQVGSTKPDFPCLWFNTK